ncbi:hypothetical protein [Anaerosporobacter sp.]|uniref:hypothetical protein n=1 Tax=Anaerosporobacter sp. TaxID=1872529 RepID=UPI00286EF1C4|nr:hypothetical protein [Anaerosporobacter sp.]
MKKKTLLLMIIMCVIGSFTGCSSENKKEENDTPAIDTPSNKKLSELEMLEKYMSIMGDTDEEVVSVLGYGTKTIDENSNAIVLRRYSLNLFGEILSMILSLEDGNVMDMSITPTSGTYDEWLQKITELLGNPDETVEAYKDQSQEVRASAWNLDNGSLTLRSVGGMVLLRVNQ